MKEAFAKIIRPKKQNSNQIYVNIIACHPEQNLPNLIIFTIAKLDYPKGTSQTK